MITLRDIKHEVDPGWEADPHPTTKEDYLACLQLLSKIRDWNKATIGRLRCHVTGKDHAGYCYAHTIVVSAFGETMALLPTVECKGRANAHSRAIRVMKTWVLNSRGFASTVEAPVGEAPHGAEPSQNN